MLTSSLLQCVLTGLTVGSVYAIVGLGFNVIYNTTGIINFAQGEFVMLGAMAMVYLLGPGQVPAPVAFVFAVALVTLVGVVLERACIHPLKGAGVLRLIIVTVGASVLLRGAAMTVTKQPFYLQPFSGERPISIMGASLDPQAVWVLGVTAAIMVGLGIFFRRTLTGKAMRACADNPEVARLLGISVGSLVLVSFALSAAIGAAAGIVVSPRAPLAYSSGSELGLKGFCASVLGGLGHAPGAVAAGFVLGLVESLVARYLPSSLKDITALAVILGVLFFRPSGIWGSLQASRLRRF